MTALLQIDRLSRNFGGVQAVDGLTLSVDAADLLCIIGPNGCGKSTLFNLITGAFPPSAGTIGFDGQDITGWPPHRIARLGIARKFQVPAIYPELSVAENVAVPHFAVPGQRGLIGLLTHRAGRTGPQDGEGTGNGPAGALDQVGLSHLADRPAGELSHGQKQWLEIAMLLVGAPRLILLDEPTAGMTPAETDATAGLIQRISRERRIAVLVIEHDISFVARLDCPVAVMMKGTIVSRGSYDSVRQDPMVQAGYLGRRAAC